MELKFSQAGGNECIRTHFQGFCLTPSNKKVRAHWKFEIWNNFLSESDIQVTYKWHTYLLPNLSFSHSKHIKWSRKIFKNKKLNKYHPYTINKGIFQKLRYIWSVREQKRVLTICMSLVCHLYVTCMSLYVTCMSHYQIWILARGPIKYVLIFKTSIYLHHEDDTHRFFCVWKFYGPSDVSGTQKNTNFMAKMYVTCMSLVCHFGIDTFLLADRSNIC